MAVLSISTNRCRACNVEKSIGDFYTFVNRHGVRYANNKCKACQSKHNHQNVVQLRQSEEGRERLRVYKRRAKLAERIKRGGKSRAERSEEAAKRRADRAQQVRMADEARNAWRHWITERAPSWWLDAYYAASGKPWTDHRLTSAEQFRLQYRLDADYNLRQRLRAAMKRKRQGIKIDLLLRTAVERNGSSPKAEQFVGYTAKELRQHLERQFTLGMTWERFCAGEIHIDHIVPLTAHDISRPDELRAAWAITNLRPLWAKDNMTKRDHRTHLL